jgi:hypothetical protein
MKFLIWLWAQVPDSIKYNVNGVELLKTTILAVIAAITAGTGVAGLDFFQLHLQDFITPNGMAVIGGLIMWGVDFVRRFFNGEPKPLPVPAPTPVPVPVPKPVPVVPVPGPNPGGPTIIP